MEKMPEQFNMPEIMGKVEERTPYVIVCFQVNHYYNIKPIIVNPLFSLTKSFWKNDNNLNSLSFLNCYYFSVSCKVKINIREFSCTSENEKLSKIDIYIKIV